MKSLRLYIFLILVSASPLAFSSIAGECMYNQLVEQVYGQWRKTLSEDIAKMPPRAAGSLDLPYENAHYKKLLLIGEVAIPFLRGKLECALAAPVDAETNSYDLYLAEAVISIKGWSVDQVFPSGRPVIYTQREVAQYVVAKLNSQPKL
jgi:hypothetical protein